MDQKSKDELAYQIERMLKIGQRPMTGIKLLATLKLKGFDLTKAQLNAVLEEMREEQEIVEYGNETYFIPNQKPVKKKIIKKPNPKPIQPKEDPPSSIPIKNSWVGFHLRDGKTYWFI